MIKLATDFGLKVTDSMRHEFQISIREKYIDKLIDNLTERFADSDMLSALITLFHSNKAASSIESVGLEEYGNSSVRVIATHFSTTVDSERLQLEWMRFKHILLNQSCETPAHDVMAVISSDSSFSSLYPYPSKIASIVLTLPVSTADCERGFSRIKTDQRNRLKTPTLDRLIRLSTEGPSIDSFDYDAVVSTWAERSSRRITV